VSEQISRFATGIRQSKAEPETGAADVPHLPGGAYLCSSNPPAWQVPPLEHLFLAPFLINAILKLLTMKTVMNKLQYVLALLGLFMFRVCAYAQDQGGSSESHTETHSSSSTGPADTTTVWYVAPWVWIVGIVLLILILFLIFRGGGGSRTDVTHVTEVRRD
jgi:hypothetical protein